MLHPEGGGGYTKAEMARLIYHPLIPTHLTVKFMTKQHIGCVDDPIG